MALLLINCPTTGKPLSTGIDVPQGMSLDGINNNRISCPYCGDVHSWNGSDAYFEGD